MKSDTNALYKLLHHYLASLYSFNETVRRTVSNYLDGENRLTKDHYSGIEYTRRLNYLRGLRTAAQHGAFTDCLEVERYDPSTKKYRLLFKESEYRSIDIDSPEIYLEGSNSSHRKQPIRYVARFHDTTFEKFVRDCLSWLKGNVKRY